MNDSITHIRLSTAEVHRIVEERLLPNLEGEPVDYTLMALFTLAAMLMKPSAGPDEIGQVVYDISQHLALSLMDAEDLGPAQ